MCLGLETRWQVGGEEYNYFKEEATLGKYCEALNELEHLVVMRLFELSKLSISGTGYKLRQKISKALQWRSEAIWKAIVRYDSQAAALNPPRAAISWEDITNYTFLGEFDLLFHSRTDIREYQWSKPAVRVGTTTYFKLCHAHKEIIRLNVEIHRLCTAIHDENQETSRVIEDLLISEPHLRLEMQRLYYKSQW
ncbi:hypothetical protein PAXRUDRAFT_37086 [Paxillus rubicundulus Ve08.2h10]|uniref:Uncharacterized protein n=1 Tax=Paxillus rubicundulus Ve08.2h10 TaxID=930991 RepID=A0A0D0CC54_9AGAM|nr:hypothetical protein PAXRUDRAFT_37086 [Paxillus rubicundulus Ve08.2h10]